MTPFDLPPVASSADARSQDFLKIAMLIVVLGSVAAFLIVGLLAPHEYRRLTGFALALVAAAATLLELRRGNIARAYAMLTYGIWCGMTLAATINGGMTAPAILVYPVLILIAGWVMGARTVLILTALSLAAELFFVIGMAHQWLPARQPVPDNWIFLAHGMMLMVSASLALFVRRGFATHFAELACRDEELSAQHALYRTLLDAQSSAGMGMFILDRGRIAFANEAACTLFGYSHDELLALPSYGELVHPDDRARVADNYRRRLAGEPLPNRYDIVALTRDGGRRNLDITIAPLPADQSGDVLVIIADITERRRAELAARRSEERFARVFQVSPVAASIARAVDGMFVEVNDVYRQYFGWTKDEMIGHTSVQIGLWPTEAMRRPWAEELVRQGELRDYETVWMHKSGEPRNVRISAVVVEFGGESCILALVHDITELRQSELHFSRVFSASPVATSISRLGDGCYIEVNAAFLRLFDLAADRVLGRCAVELGIWPEPAARQAWLDALQRDGRVLEYETQLRDRHGAARTVAISAEVIDFAEQRCILSFVHDITARRRAETMLREIVEGTSRVTGGAFFHALVQHLARALDVPYALIGEVAPGDGTKLHTLAFWAGDRFAAETDYELATTPCGAVFGQSPRLFASGLAAQFPPAGCTLQAAGADSYHGYPLADASGAPLGVLAIMDRRPLPPSEERDSLMAVFAARAAAELERQRAEEGIRESEQKFSRIFQASPVAISISRLSDGYYLEVNDAYVRLFGWEREQMIGRTSADIALWADPERRQQWIAALREKGRVGSYEALLKSRAGTEHSVLVSAEMLDFGGEPCALAFLYDITERKHTERWIRELNADLEERVARRTAELTEANRELESFAYSISHDLRAPLRGIDGFSRLLQEEYAASLDQQGNEYLMRVRRAAQRLGTLIDDLLELSRVTRQEMRRVKVDLSALVADIVEDLRKAEPERAVAVVIAPRCNTEGDPQLLRVLLENLIGNAWKYSRHTAGAQIAFGADASGADTIYYVRDNGAGFDMAYADKLFAPFQRLHNPADFEGSGIGLASAARIVRRHGGKIWADSAPGAGATFHFTLGGRLRNA